MEKVATILLMFGLVGNAFAIDPPSTVPEPGTIALLAVAGLAGLGIIRNRRK